MVKKLNRTLPMLVGVVGLNYVAQIPYYLHQYYFPKHLAPSPIGLLLLGLTLCWFLVGYIRYYKVKRYGWGLLVSFLLTQVLFYGHAILLGAFVRGGALAQLKTNSPFLLIIFLIGYLNFLVAAYYLWWLWKRGRPSHQ